MGALRVLFVVDEEGVRDVAREFLEGEGFHVTLAVSAEDAIHAFRDAAFDAVVTDYKMPGANGADLARHLRSLRPRLPIILLTGFMSALDREAMSRLFDEILEKPMGVTRMAEALLRHRPKRSAG